MRTQLPVFQWCVGVVLALLVFTTPASAEPEAQPATEPTSNDISGGQPMPHLAIDPQRRYVDLDATVVMQQGGWLELLACTPQTRTHESILAVHAKPSHIHLAMLTLGLEPGATMRWRQDGDQYHIEPARGPKIAVSIVMQQDGQTTETPANQWVVDRKTGQAMQDNIWLFTGSSFDESRNPPLYRADVGGSVLSLVNFGDEVLARPTDKTNQTDQKSLAPNADRIPAIGTAVKIRLRPLSEPTACRKK